MGNKKSVRDGEHVFFSGGRRAQVLEEWEACLRRGTPILEPWSVHHIEEMLDALASIELDDPCLERLLLPQEISKVRKARRLSEKALKHGNIYRAGRCIKYAWAMLNKAMHYEDVDDARELRADRKRRKAGGGSTNLRYDEAKTAAREIASELWAADTEDEYTKSDMIDWCSQHLEREGLYKPSARTLWSWLQEEPSVIPDYVTRRGRRKKT